LHKEAGDQQCHHGIHAEGKLHEEIGSGEDTRERKGDKAHPPVKMNPREEHKKKEDEPPIFGTLKADGVGENDGQGKSRSSQASDRQEVCSDGESSGAHKYEVEDDGAL
jgi:hypothetical protein